MILADHVGRIVDETVVRVSAAIQDKVGAHVETAQAACARSRDTLAAAFDGNPDEAPVRETLTSQQHALLDALDEDILAPLADLRESRLLNALLDRMLQQFSDLAAAVPETYQVIEPGDLPAARQSSLTPPEARLKIAPMQKVTRAYLETRLARNLAEANQTLFREVDVALDALTEVRHLVRYNLQAALDELDGAAEDAARARELALGGLERARTRLEQTREQVEHFADEVHRQIYESTQGLVSALDTEITGQTAFTLRLQQERQQALTRAAASVREVAGGLRQRLRRLYRTALRRFRPLAEDLVREVRSTLPLDELEPAEALSRYDLARLDADRIERLPFIYQKLFSFAPLEADEFLVGRREAQQTCELALRRWAAGTPTSVAVIGEPGVGVSSFLNRVARQVGEQHRVHHVRFTQTPSLEEALARLLARRLDLPRARDFEDLARQIRTGLGGEQGRAVVLLEDAHHLYRRTPGGFDVLKRLLLLVATTGDRFLWILSMNSHAWRYLDAAVSLADAFAFTVRLSPLSRGGLEEAVLARHRFSGLNLRFLPSLLMRQRRRYRRADEAGQQAMIQAAFFDQLHRLSGGNPLAALFYWLKAIDDVQDHRLTVRPLDRQPFGYVRSLEVEALLTLKVVLQQGALTVEEHARLFGAAQADSHATLMHLVHLNLLTRHDHTAPPTFCLNGPIYKPLAQELAAMNLLD